MLDHRKLLKNWPKTNQILTLKFPERERCLNRQPKPESKPTQGRPWYPRNLQSSLKRESRSPSQLVTGSVQKVTSGVVGWREHLSSLELWRRSIWVGSTFGHC